MSYIKKADVSLVQSIELEVTMSDGTEITYQRSSIDPRVSAQWYRLYGSSWEPIHGPEEDRVNMWYVSRYVYELRSDGSYVRNMQTGETLAKL